MNWTPPASPLTSILFYIYRRRSCEQPTVQGGMRGRGRPRCCGGLSVRLHPACELRPLAPNELQALQNGLDRSKNAAPGAVKLKLKNYRRK